MSSDLLGKLLALFSAFAWAVGVIFFKKAGKIFPPLLLNLYKSLVAAFLLLPIFLVGGISLAPPDLAGRDWLMTAASGFLGMTVADSLFFFSLNRIGAGLAAICECLYSPFVLLFSWLVLPDPIRPAAIAGAGLVIAGVVVATQTRGKSEIPKRKLWTGVAAGTLAMFFMGASIVLMKPIFQKASFFWVTEVRLLAAIVTLLPLLLLHAPSRRSLPLMLGRDTWRHAFPGALLGSFLSMTCWVAAFKLTNVTSAAVLNQTNTILIVVLASLWLKEPFTRRRLLATLLATAGSVLVLFP